MSLRPIEGRPPMAEEWWLVDRRAGDGSLRESVGGGPRNNSKLFVFATLLKVHAKCLFSEFWSSERNAVKQGISGVTEAESRGKKFDRPVIDG